MLARRGAVALLALLTVAPHSAPAASPRSSIKLHLLSCATGSIGQIPQPLPPDYETQFAVAVIDVYSARPIPYAPLPTLKLVDQNLGVVVTKRVISIQGLNRHANLTRETNYLALDDNGGRPWNHALSQGMTRLRIRVALATQAYVSPPARCRIEMGPYNAERRVDAGWPTG